MKVSKSLLKLLKLLLEQESELLLARIVHGLIHNYQSLVLVLLSRHP